uniref:Transporter n=1 Tax=Macrostomum lignano TaxID=282301 RepID=A0A1I8FCH0_9PLAT
RLFIVALTVIGVLWLPIVRTSGGGQLVIYAQSVTSYLTPPILTVFLMASLWPRTTEPGVFWGLLVSMVIGVVWMVLNFVYPPPQLRRGGHPACAHCPAALPALRHRASPGLPLLLRWFCGFSDVDNGGAATEEERKAADAAEAAERARQLVAEMKSGSAWDRVVNCSALLLFAVGSFLWGLLA